MSWKFYCFNYHDENKWNETEITIDFKVLPCCVYHSAAPDGITNDPYLDNLPNDWNDLTKHSMEEIMNHKVFTKYLTDDNWQDENKCPPFCKELCGPKKEVKNS